MAKNAMLFLRCWLMAGLACFRSAKRSTARGRELIRQFEKFIFDPAFDDQESGNQGKS
jgi:hypothetical protein